MCSIRAFLSELRRHGARELDHWYKFGWISIFGIQECLPTIWKSWWRTCSWFCPWDQWSTRSRHRTIDLLDGFNRLPVWKDRDHPAQTRSSSLYLLCYSNVRLLLPTWNLLPDGCFGYYHICLDDQPYFCLYRV